MIEIGVSLPPSRAGAQWESARTLRLLDRAIVRITAAQKDHDFKLGGHAQRAKELIDQAAAN